MLNERGWHPGKGGLFTKGIIACIQNHYRLRSRFDRLREAGMLTQQEVSAGAENQPAMGALES
jgi:hypothetical protein